MASLPIDPNGRLLEQMGVFGYEDDQGVKRTIKGGAKDMFIINMFKSMGLSDETMIMIERDLRRQHIEASKKQLMEMEQAKANK